MKNLRRNWPTIGVSLGVASAACITAISVSADAPPVLRISQQGSNVFNVVITNGVATTNYTLFWTDVIGDVNYPWLPLWVGGVGETNFAVQIPDMNEMPQGWFKVLIGSDSDGDGVLEQQDADSNDPSVGILSVTINNPADGAVLQ